MHSASSVQRWLGLFRSTQRGFFQLLAWSWCALALLFGGSGCASYQAFVPVADVTARSPDEQHTAAEYPLEAKQQRLGEARVWSEGVLRDDTQSKDQPLLHVGFSLHNLATVPLRLDPERLFLEDVVVVMRDTIHRLPVTRVEGNEPIPPSATRSIDIYFALPPRIRPNDVVGYRVSWAVAGEGLSVEEHTAFRSTRAVRAYYAYYPGSPYPGYPWAWYDPWYSPWDYPYYYPYSPYGYVRIAPVLRGRVYGPRVLARPRVR